MYTYYWLEPLLAPVLMKLKSVVSFLTQKSRTHNDEPRGLNSSHKARALASFFFVERGH